MLNNLRIVELGQAFAGPFSAGIFADLGAEVIKIEHPQGGDSARKWGPPFWGEDAAVFHGVNRNKKSVTLDLKGQQGIECCLQIISEADVLVHNMRPGALEKLGLGYEVLAKKFPRLIYAEISAFGHTGPLEKYPGYEILSQAFGGIMSITGEADGSPVRCGPSVCDFGSGMWLTIGILAALNERERTGAGKLVQTSLLETALVWTAVSASGYLATGDEPKRMGAGHHLVAPYGKFETLDGDILLACANDNLFVKLSQALNVPELSTDSRYYDNPGRTANKVELELIVAGILKQQTQAHWFKLLNEAGVPCSPLNSVSEALEQEQTKSLAIVQEHPEDASIKSIGFPVSFNGERPKVRAGSPLLGSANDNYIQ